MATTAPPHAGRTSAQSFAAHIASDDPPSASDIVGWTISGKGPDWKWGTQGSGGVGVVTSVDITVGWVNVKWEDGTSNDYRWGFECGDHKKCYDLRLVRPPSVIPWTLEADGNATAFKIAEALEHERPREALDLLHAHPEAVHAEFQGLGYGGDTRVLHAAAYYGNEAMVEAALNAGALVNAQNNAGFTAMHYAVQENHVGILRTLLKHGADTNAITESKRTALHLAAFRGREDAVRALLEHGADTTLKDMFGDTAADDACTRGHATICALLKTGSERVNGQAMVSLPTGSRLYRNVDNPLHERDHDRDPLECFYTVLFDGTVPLDATLYAAVTREKGRGMEIFEFRGTNATFLIDAKTGVVLNAYLVYDITRHRPSPTLHSKVYIMSEPAYEALRMSVVDTPEHVICLRKISLPTWKTDFEHTETVTKERATAVRNLKFTGVRTG